MAKQIEWDVAEVLDYDYTYQYIASGKDNSTTNKLFALRVRSASGYFNEKPFLAKPSNINTKQIPLVGEFVLIYKTFNQESTGKKWRESWYYVTSIDMQSAINENMLPGLSNGDDQETIDNTQPGKTFKSKSISPLQPYEGDLLTEGRFGNSIRLGSSISTSYPAGYYHKAPKWFTPGGESDPIIILSNGRKHLSDKEFVVEDINTDAASIYLTSTQVIDMDMSRPLSKYNTFAGSQFLANANRVVIRANTDVAVIDSEKAIVLNTPGEVRIGGDDPEKSQPMVHGQTLYNIIQRLIQAISLGNTPQGTPIGLTELAAIQTELTSILSTKYYVEDTSVPIP
jgi:hypothetical protein